MNIDVIDIIESSSCAGSCTDASQCPSAGWKMLSWED
jgi:hypothetical protein